MTSESNLAARFYSIAKARSKQTAISYPDGRDVSYSQLNTLACQIANLLHEKGVQREDVVAILNSKSPEGFATMIACLSLGAIYTNLDPNTPKARGLRMAQNCQPKLLINTYPESNSYFKEISPRIDLHSPKIKALLGTMSSEARNTSSIDGFAPAYIMFTSGSTGHPKGVLISHCSLLKFTNWTKNRFAITPKDRFSNANPLFFDNSVFDFYASIFNGASLIPISEEDTRDAQRLAQIINKTHCTIWFSVPSLLVYLLTMRALDKNQFKHIRKIIFGGEGFPKPRLKELYDLFSQHADLENVYGPTEGTCICSAHKVEEPDFRDMTQLATLGHITSDFGYEILPHSDDPEYGELFLTGSQIAMGYYNDSKRTDEVFVQNPTHSRFKDIGYHTGDLVKRDDQNRLHFKGRIDFQIKHMGYRIELEEIESALYTIAEVNEAAAIYQSLGDGMGRIVGFVSLSKPIDKAVIIAGLEKQLPHYMIPKHIKILKTLAKNRNGKIDRTALITS